MNSEELIDLVNKVQKGDKKALKALCLYAGGIMSPYFKRKFYDDNIVNDLVQETYKRLLNSFNNIREPMRFKNFVLKTAFHVVQDYFREKIKNNQNQTNIDFTKSKSDGTITSSLQIDEGILNSIDIRSALKRLPEKSQLILRLQAEGYKYFEIAHMIGQSESAVKMQVKRSLEKLQAYFNV